MNTRHWLSAAVLSIAAGAAISSCGGDDPFCGNGFIDIGEQCDDGNDDQTDVCLNNCTIRSVPTLTLKWEFNKDAVPDFPSDSCTDLGVSRVEVELSGPTSMVMEEMCSFRQLVFEDIAPGTYAASFHLLDLDGNELTATPHVEMVDFTSGQLIREVIIGPTGWTRSYTGTFFFRLSWAGADCNLASPAVAEHMLLLEQGGQPVTGITTDDGDTLDGSSAGSCRSLVEGFPQSALQVPFGPATFTVVGLDSVGTPQFEGTFETFIGAGANNPELTFDIPSLAPDAGTPDAGLADAGAPDA
jgi:cysteine-rich repeat protein